MLINYLIFLSFVLHVCISYLLVYCPLLFMYVRCAFVAVGLLAVYWAHELKWTELDWIMCLVTLGIHLNKVINLLADVQVQNRWPKIRHADCCRHPIRITFRGFPFIAVHPVPSPSCRWGFCSRFVYKNLVVLCISCLYTYRKVQQDATPVSWFYCKITLHVSGTFRNHHQEYNTL
jgi:hypothetical protein